jgi:lipoate-protein ligase B
MELTAETNKKRYTAIRDCGLADYREILGLQQGLHRERQKGNIPDTVIVVEHPSVITLGARQTANKLRLEPAELTNRGIDVVEVRRGGGTTAHNPGQLVVYPILHLQQLGLGVTEYIRRLEAIGMELLESLGVRSERRTGFPGLWVLQKNSKIEIRNSKMRKIASIGVRVSRGVSYHGMAINIQNDLSIFELIVPCGLEGIEMTSVLKETGKRHEMNEVKQQLAGVLTKCFG